MQNEYVLNPKTNPLPSFMNPILDRFRLNPTSFHLNVGLLGEDKENAFEVHKRYVESRIPHILPYWQEKDRAALEGLKKLYNARPNGAYIGIYGAEGQHLFRFKDGKLSEHRGSYSESAINDEGKIEFNIMQGFDYLIEEGEVIFTISHSTNIHVIRCYIHPNTLPQYFTLPKEQDLTRNEKIVLVSYGYKNSYGGETDCRFKQAFRSTQISKQDYKAAHDLCVTKGLIKKAGSGFTITAEGKNVTKNIHSFSQC